MPPEECFDKLEQLILDENELVTYKLLSKELKIHVNEAKKCLHDFLTSQNSKGDIKLFAHYFISGFILKDGFRSRKVIIVSEEKLEQVKKDFEEVVSTHIYSVNKGGCRDASAIYNAQSWCKKWAGEHQEYSAIKHPNIKIQAPVLTKPELKKNDSKVFSSKPLPIKTKNESVSSMFQNSKKEVKSIPVSSNGEKSASEIANVSENQAVEPKPANSAKSNSESKDPKKSTLSSMWQKLEDKTKDGKTENSKSESKGKNKSQGTSKTVGKNNIMSMFSKQAERNAANPTKKLPDPILSTEKESKNTAPSEIEKETDKVAPVKNKTKTSQRKSKRSSKPVSDNDSEEDAKPKKKKHRRICTMDDSDSESENEEEQDKAQRLLTSTENDETPMALSDNSEEPIPPTPPVLPNKGKKKVWKTVQKTYQDEDGFLVAKQEKVLVSGSDSEEDPLPKKNSIKKEEPKQNTFLYRKQASLTSFFKQQ